MLFVETKPGIVTLLVCIEVEVWSPEMIVVGRPTTLVVG